MSKLSLTLISSLHVAVRILKDQGQLVKDSWFHFRHSKHSENALLVLHMNRSEPKT